MTNTSIFIRKNMMSITNRLLCLLIVPQSGLELYSQFPQVFLGDCTFKTNRFNLPLFNICGATHTRKTFQLAAAFINKEDCETNAWVLDQLTQILERHNIRPPNVTIVDRELTLIKALRSNTFFGTAQLLLCR